MLPVTLDDVRNAARTIDGSIEKTPTIPAPALSSLLGCTLFLKPENLQRTGSFKERGALNVLSTLDADRRARGVIAMSAGNHAQGVAYHASRLGIPSTIVMPAFTPFTKVARTESFGARVELFGESLSEAQGHAERLAEEQGLTLVHPYDDPAIVAGQGTIALEMLAAVPDLDAILVPIGGGGLIGGIATVAKALNPGIRIVGVQAAGYPAMRDAVAGRAGSYSGGTIAEGIAVKEPGRLTRQLVEALVDEIVVVDEPTLERAVHALATVQKLVAEGAGAAGLAAILADPGRWEGRRIGLPISGGNIDPRILSSVLLRGLVRDGQLVRLRVRIEDVPGALGKLAAIIGRCGGNIVEVYHQRLVFEVSVKRIDVDVMVETRDRGHVDRIIAALEAGGFPSMVASAVG